TTLMAVREEIGTTFLWGVAAMLLIKVIRKADGWSKKDFLWAGLIVNVFFAGLHVKNALNIYQSLLDNHGVIVAIIGWVTMILFAFVFGMYTEMVFFKTHNLFVTIICHIVITLSRGVSIFGRLELFDVKSLVVFNLVTCVYGLVTFWIYKSNWKDTFWEKELGLKGQTEPL
ncbi:MAG: CPBP family glutamic-type intramembrane protease, partial [Lachnospiraceae bacterium]